LKILQKQPAEKLAFDFDFSAVIQNPEVVASIISIIAVTCGVVAGSAGVTLSNNTFGGRAAQTTVDGGTAAESYKLTCKITDSQGQKHELDGIVEVIEL
jgi:hypothetical protein